MILLGGTLSRWCRNRRLHSRGRKTRAFLSYARLYIHTYCVSRETAAAAGARRLLLPFFSGFWFIFVFVKDTLCVSGCRLARGRCSGLSLPRSTRVRRGCSGATRRTDGRRYPPRWSRCTWNIGISIFSVLTHTHTHTSEVYTITHVE